MKISLPSNPVIGQKYIVGSIIYVWDGRIWKAGDIFSTLGLPSTIQLKEWRN